METDMSKWVRFEKSPWGLSGSLVLFSALCFYAGRSDDWGIAATISFYDRSITFKILNLYFGVEIWYSKESAG
jgi:hypothetical protein